MARNIATGKAGRQTSAVLGLDEMKKKIKLITGAMAEAEARSIVGAAAFHVYTEIRSGARAARVPHEIYEDMFVYNRPHPQARGGGGKNARVSALTGVRKRGRFPVRGTPPRWPSISYVEWKVKAAYTRIKMVRVRLKALGGRFGAVARRGGEVGAGSLVGENLATMYELGTSKMPARPFFRQAIERARNRVLEILTVGYAKMIERYAKANP